MYQKEISLSNTIYDYNKYNSNTIIKNIENEKHENILDNKILNGKLKKSNSLTKNIYLERNENTYTKNTRNSYETNKKENKIKKMFTGLGNQMKNAMNVFGEVKEQIKYTANEATKNINNPFCKTQCNIENIKNGIYINEGEIVIKKNLYSSLFKKNKNESDINDEKKKKCDNIFTCDMNNIIIKGDYNFGFDIKIKYENEENKIIANVYDKETKKKIPCSYKWKKITKNKKYSQFEYTNNNNNNNCNIYNNYYELTCDDIGYIICVECTCINSDQVTVNSFSDFKENINEKDKYNNVIKNKTEIFESYENTYNFNKYYYGTAKAYIGPFILTIKTKKMLEKIISNNTIRYPIYIIKKVKENNSNVYENSLYENSAYDNSVYDNTNDSNSVIENNSYENDNDSNNNNTYENIYMLYIYKNEIKIINQNNKMKHIYNFNFNNIYPYIEFLENSYLFKLHISKNEYFICKCIYKKHRDLITIILRYMHANIYVLNDYIFNNINENFENISCNNIYNNVRLNTLLENIHKELFNNQHLSQKYNNKINSLQLEKNMLEDELKSTIEAFQLQLDDAKKTNNDELKNQNEKLMNDIKILQEKFKDVDMFFKNKYKLLIEEIEKYKKLAEEKETNLNVQNINEISGKNEKLENEKKELLNKYGEVNKSYNEEKLKNEEMKKIVEELNKKLNQLNKNFEIEKIKGIKNTEYIKEIEQLKKNNDDLQEANLKYQQNINILTTEKNRLTKLISSLTKDIEKLKNKENSSILDNENIKNEKNSLDKNIEDKNLLKELMTLKNENELLKTRIKKIAKINNI